MEIHVGYKLGYDYRTIPPMFGKIKYLYAESKANNFRVTNIKLKQIHGNNIR